MPEKSVIVLGASVLVEPMIKKVKEYGYKCIVMEWNLSQPALKYADEIVHANLKEPEDYIKKAKEIAKKNNVIGVTTCGADIEVTVADIAHELNLPSISPESARLSNNKLLMRQKLKESGIDRVKWTFVTRLEEAKAFIKRVGFPVIIKPIDNCASRGVFKVRNLSELEEYFNISISYNVKEQGLLIEEYLDGPRQTVEMIVYENKPYLVSIIDTHYIYENPQKFPFGDYPVETSLHPTLVNKKMQKKLFTFSAKIAEILGINIGPFKVDTTIIGEEVYVIEVTARLSGGFHCQYATPIAYGTDEIGATLDLAIGKPLDMEKIRHKWERGSCVRAIFPRPGKIVAIKGVKEALKLPYVKKVFIMKEVGEEIAPYRNSSDRVAYVITSGDTTLDAIKNAEKAAKIISIETR